MATELETSLGFTVAVEDGEPSTFDQAGFEDASMAYDLIQGITSVDGDLGFSFNVQTSMELATGVTKSAKGGKTFSPLTIMVLSGSDSSGRTTLETAASSQNGQVSLKLQDSAGNSIYLCGIVATDTRSVGNADNVGMKSYSFTPNYDKVEVAA